jgi:hypothetical protein
MNLEPVRSRPFGQRRFCRGRKVESVMDAVECIYLGVWLYWRDGRPLNPAVAMNMSLATIRGAVSSGKIFVALETRRPAAPSASDPEFAEVPF